MLGTTVPIAANTVLTESKIVLTAGASFVINAGDQFALSFTLMGIARHETTGAVVPICVECALGAGTDIVLYTVPTEYYAFVNCKISNDTGSASTYTLNLTDIEVVGGSGA